jgi:hypothetical protein
MALNDAAALKNAISSFCALASISRHNARAGYDRAGFSFEKGVDGISLSFAGHEVAVMAPGFTRDDIRTDLLATVEHHLDVVVPLLKAHLKAELKIPDTHYLHFDGEFDLPRILSTELKHLAFKVVRNMEWSGCIFSFSLEEPLVRVGSHPSTETFKGRTYFEMLEPAIDHFNGTFLRA